MLCKTDVKGERIATRLPPFEMTVLNVSHSEPQVKESVIPKGETDCHVTTVTRNDEIRNYLKSNIYNLTSKFVGRPYKVKHKTALNVSRCEWR